MLAFASTRRSRSFAPVGAQDDKRAFASEKKEERKTTGAVLATK